VDEVLEGEEAVGKILILACTYYGSGSGNKSYLHMYKGKYECIELSMIG
jgi:hypothetical protein